MSEIQRYLATERRTAIERYVKSEARAVAKGDKTLCRVLASYFAVVDLDDYTVAPHLAVDGYWEMWVTMALAKRAKPGWHSVDVGALFGYYTLILADFCGKDSRVTAWEPNDSAANCLEQTLRLNHLEKRVRVLRYAAGAKSERAALIIPEDRWADATVSLEVMAPIREEQLPASRVMIEVDRLDRVHTEPVDFVKIDAEGSEPLVWQGMTGLFGKRKLHVLLEFMPGKYPDASGFLDQIEGRMTLERVNPHGDVVKTNRDEVLASEFEMLWLEEKSR